MGGLALAKSNLQLTKKNCDKYLTHLVLPVLPTCPLNITSRIIHFFFIPFLITFDYLIFYSFFPFLHFLGVLLFLRWFFSAVLQLHTKIHIRKSFGFGWCSNFQFGCGFGCVYCVLMGRHQHCDCYEHLQRKISTQTCKFFFHILYKQSQLCSRKKLLIC